jgi:hypothetical protein
MIIWNGRGFLVAVFVFGCSLCANLISNSVMGSGTYWDQHKWPLGVSLLVAAILSWSVGRFLANQKARTLIDKETGEDIVIEPCHTLFFIRMHRWGPILGAVGVALVVVDLMK